MAVEWTKSGLDLHLERRPGTGRRAGLEEALRTAITDGRLRAGDRVPPTRALATELRVARGTVTAAYQQLVAEGYLTARNGAGTRVAALPDTALSGPGAPAPPRPPMRHDLMPGRPDTAAFPRQEWLRATRQVLAELPAAELVPETVSGVRPLQEALVGYLGRTRGVRTRPERIVITTGFQQSLSLLAQCLTDDRPMALEDPCLHFHRDVVRRAGRSVLPLPVDAFGATSDVPSGTGAVVVTPAHQAVLGVVLAPERRRALVDWASRANGLIIEDDYDGEFRYDQHPVGALQAMAPERVVYVGTTSKTLAPGVRLGWMVVPEHLVELVTEAKFLADGTTEVLGQHVLARLITNHAYDRHIRTQRIRYRHRRDALVTRLRQEVPAVRVRGAAAGVQVLLELPPSGPSAVAVERAAAARGVRLTTADPGWHHGDREEGADADRSRAVIVGYGAPPDHGFAAAVDALVETLRAVLPSRGTTDGRLRPPVSRIGP